MLVGALGEMMVRIPPFCGAAVGAVVAGAVVGAAVGAAVGGAEAGGFVAGGADVIGGAEVAGGVVEGVALAQPLKIIPETRITANNRYKTFLIPIPTS